VTDLLEPGTNQLNIRVTNLWPNRLIGDRQPNAMPIAFTTFNPYSADSLLLDSGLRGRLRSCGPRFSFPISIETDKPVETAIRPH